jgi:hypothetical protein
MRQIATLVAAVTLVSCGGTGGQDGVAQTQEVPIAAEYVLGYGESLQVQGGLNLEFTSVEDSRCPLNIECFWEGNALVRLTAKTTRGTSVLELYTPSSAHASGQVDGLFAVTLRKLEPYPGSDPQSGAGSLPASYKATLYVGRATR